MKKRRTISKTGLAGLFLLISLTTSAQINSLDDFGTFTGIEGNGSLSVAKVYCLASGVSIPAAHIDGGGIPGITYSWSRIDGNDYTLAPTPIASTAPGDNFVDNTIPGPGFYIYRVTAENAETCESEITEFLVYVLPNITVAITPNGPSEYCAGQSPGLTLTATAGSSETVGEVFQYNFEWTKTGEAAPVGSTNELTFTAGTSYSGEYTVTATYAIEPNCPSAAASETITENATPSKPVITF